MLELFFSPAGSVGRATWWGMQTLCIVVLLALIAMNAGLSIPYLPHVPSGQVLTPYSAIHEFLATFKRMATNQPGPAFVLVSLFALTYWVSSVIEIKRWHEREMSGFWFLLRFVVFFLPGTPTGGFFLTVVTLFQLINLGFLGPGSVAMPRDRRDPRDKKRAAAENILRPIRLVFRTLLVLGLGCLFLGLTLPFWVRVLNLPRTSTAASPSRSSGSIAQTAPAAATSPNRTSLADAAPKPLDESAYRGTSAANFARSWVMVNGAKVDGIMAANPAPHAQVALLNVDGGMNVPAASLPQGFLDAWNLTPQRLKAADQP